MNRLARYVIATVLSAVGLVMVVLLVLGALFIFIGEQGDIGRGQYSALQALLYSLMSLPQFTLEALPAGALIGSLLGFGLLARSHELTAMRSLGMRKTRIFGAALAAGALLLCLALLVGEFMAPPMERWAEERKAFQRYNNVSLAGAGGAWIRDGDTLINVQRLEAEDAFGGLLIFRLTPPQRLAAVARADSATLSARGAWQLSGYAESRFSGDRVVPKRVPAEHFDHLASAGFLQLANASPGDLSLRTLQRVIGYLHQNRLRADPYVFALWARLARTAAIVVAVLFGLPLAFGSLRTAGAGARTTLGMAIGIVYFFLQRLVESGSIVFGLNPILLAWIPCALLAAASAILYARAR